jgi:hypothetical protein
MARWVWVIGLTACRGTLQIGSAEDVATLCERETPTVETFTLTFPADPPGCAWGEDGNLEMAQGVVTARAEQHLTLPLPEDAVVCDLTLDFEVDPGFEQALYYDDNMFLTFNGVVLAASYGPMVDPLPKDGIFAAWDWAALAGTPFAFDSSIPSYCLGEAEGQSECDIPPPETNGPVALAFDPALVSELSFRAVQAGTFDYSFVTIGDNDPVVDCYHDAFTIEVEAPYVVQ